MQLNFDKTLRRFKPFAKSYKLIDAHCHLDDERITDEIPQAKESGISGFISSALSKDEFQWHLNCKIPKMKWCAGLHPNYEKSDESDLDLIIQFCENNDIIGIGEIGLDNRNDNDKWQTDILLKQLDIAHQFDLPVIFHTVGKYYELYKLLKNNFPRVRGFLHGFNASKDIAETFSRFDLAFSIGCKHPKLDCLKYVLKRGFYLFETDAPYQKPVDSEDEYNHLLNLFPSIDIISRSTGRDIEELLKIQQKSYEVILPNF